MELFLCDNRYDHWACFKIIQFKMAKNYSDEGWGKKPDSSRRAFTWSCLHSFTGGQFLALERWRVHKASVCTREWRFLTWIQTWFSLCRLMMLSRKSALERITWLKKRFVWTEVSMNGQEEVEAGAVPLTYLRYGNTVPVHLQHQHILPPASEKSFIHLRERVHRVTSGYP